MLRGFLTGTIKRDAAPPPDSRIAWATENRVGGITSPGMSRFVDDPQYWRIVDTLDQVATQTGNVNILATRRTL